MREFNVTGPCEPDLHYLLSPLDRAPRIVDRVRRRCFLSVSGPRQSGKTSLLKALVDQINANGWARAVLLSCERAGQRHGVVQVEDAERVLLEHWHRLLGVHFREVSWPSVDRYLTLAPAGRVGAALTDWALASDRPLVLVIDEVDTLAREPFLALLAQIRSGYTDRGQLFPHAIVLAGMRSLRDHDLSLGGDGRGSPFNIVEPVTVGNFTPEELTRLYAQHTDETGQAFSAGAVAVAWDQTRGQPWLVNAVARIAVAELATERSSPVEAADIEEAVRRVEVGGSTHLTSLARRLAEDRIMKVVAPVVAGDYPKAPADDIRYAVELGILEQVPGDRLQPANPIYARALLKLVTAPERASLANWSPTWLVDGQLDLERLKENFLAFWLRHRDMMRDRIGYPESVAHFGLMTYLDRVVNGGGRVDREFAVGRGRLDLLLIHGDTRLPIEVKVQRDHDGDPVPEGLRQLDRYCNGLRLTYGWLVVFDQRASATGTRLESEEVVTSGGVRVVVIRA